MMNLGLFRKAGIDASSFAPRRGKSLDSCRRLVNAHLALPRTVCFGSLSLSEERVRERSELAVAKEPLPGPLLG
jgi:hypothetical protein